MECNAKCGEHQSMAVSVAFVRGRINVIILLLVSIVGLSGWTTIVATDSKQDIAILNNTFVMTAKSHEKSSKIMIEQIIALEGKDEDKDRRIEDIEEICFFND